MIYEETEKRFLYKIKWCEGDEWYLRLLMKYLILIFSIEFVNETVISPFLDMASSLQSAVEHISVRCRQQRSLLWDVWFLQLLPLRVIALQGQFDVWFYPDGFHVNSTDSAKGAKTIILINIITFYKLYFKRSITFKSIL